MMRTVLKIKKRKRMMKITMMIMVIMFFYDRYNDCDGDGGGERYGRGYARSWHQKL